MAKPAAAPAATADSVSLQSRSFAPKPVELATAKPEGFISRHKTSLMVTAGVGAGLGAGFGLLHGMILGAYLTNPLVGAAGLAVGALAGAGLFAGATAAFVAAKDAVFGH